MKTKETKITLEEGTTKIETYAPAFIDGDIENSADLVVVRLPFLKDILSGLPSYNLQELKEELCAVINDYNSFTQMDENIEKTLSFHRLVKLIQGYIPEEGQITHTTLKGEAIIKNCDLTDE